MWYMAKLSSRSRSSASVGGMRLSGPEVWRIPQQQIQHRKEYILLRLVISEVDLFLDVVLS